MKFIVVFENGEQILASSLDIQNDVVFIDGGLYRIPQCQIEAIKIG